MKHKHWYYLASNLSIFAFWQLSTWVGIFAGSRIPDPTRFGLDFALSIGFDTGPSNQFDKFSSILVPREGRCQVTSFTRSDPPPPSVKKKKKNKVVAEQDATPN